MIGDAHHVLALWLAIYRDINRRAHHLQLLYSSRTVNVTRHEQRLLALLGLQHVGKFAAERCLTRALQTRHQYYRRLSRELQFRCCASHQRGEFVVNYLHHQLTRLNGREHVHSKRLLLHRVGELLRHFIVNVGIEQRTAHVLQGFRNVYLGDFAFTFKYLKRPFKSVT